MTCNPPFQLSLIGSILQGPPGTLKQNDVLMIFDTYAIAVEKAKTLPNHQCVEAPGPDGMMSRFTVKDGLLIFKNYHEADTVVRSMAQLLNAEKAGNVQMVAFYEKGRGRGYFYWAPNQLKTDHDGSFIVSPTVPWDGEPTTIAAFISGSADTDRFGKGCWIRVPDKSETVACAGAVGDDTADDTASVFAAKKYFDSLSRPTVFPEGFKCVLNQPLVINKNYTGIVFLGEFQPYSYQSWAAMPQGIRFNVTDGLGSRAGITIDALAPVIKNFGISAPSGDGFSFDLCSYSGRYENVRVLGFNGSVALRGEGSNVTEPIFNSFYNFDCYSLNYGLVMGRDSALQKKSGAANENTFINCRFRGITHALWATKEVTPVSYGTVFINCIFQETPPVGESSQFYDILKFEGGQIRGVQFIGGRIESVATAGRRTPRIDLAGVDVSKPLFFFHGTYIHTTIAWNDPNNVRGGIGDVYDAAARFYGVYTKFLYSPILAPRDDLEGLLLCAKKSTTLHSTAKLEADDTSAGFNTTAPYSTTSNTYAYNKYTFRQGNSWRTAQVGGKVLLASPGLVFTVENNDLMFLRSSGLIPLTDGSLALGTSTNRFSSGNFVTGILVGGHTVLRTQQAAIPNATAGNEAASINLILTALRNHGLIAV